MSPPHERKVLPLLAVAIVWAGLAGDAVGQGSAASDRVALEALFDATDGSGWTNSTNWLTDAPLSDWFGVTTDDSGRVTELQLTYNDLAGALPPALGDLVGLERLTLDGNRLTGPIPAELGRLENLQNLELQHNGFTGSMPHELGNLAKLQILTLWRNDLTGAIPSELGQLENLLILSLDGNDLTGAIPASLGDLAALWSLELGGNSLTGPIPGTLANLANLRRLHLGRNGLTGSVPTWLGDLRDLEDLILAGNALTGPIPSGLENLPALELVDLSYNWGLSGPLPAAPELPSLDELNILVTQACAPAAWKAGLAAVDFTGRWCGSEPEVTIDVAVVHTRAAREAAGGAAAIGAEIDLMIAETNQAYAASGVRHRVALVERSEVSYVDSRDGSVDLERLADPSDGHLDDVHALRDRVGADVVHLIIGRSDLLNICGIANLGGPFGVTKQGCGGRTFAHELGHNLGLVHDRYTNDGSAGGGGAHPAHGHVNQRGLAADAPESSRWITIMAYRSQCYDAGVDCQELLRFANPQQRLAGDPLGVAFGARGSGGAGPADTVAVLETTGPAVAAWRGRRPRPANRSPVAVGSLPNRRLAPRDTLTVDVSRVFVDPDGDALTYAVSTSAPGVVVTRAAGARVMLTAVGEGTATIRVTATDPGGLSAVQSFTVTVSTTVSVAFTDDPLQPGVTPVKGVHFTELRTRIDGLRSAAGLLRFSWTDPVLRAGVTRVRRVHLLELRSALAEAYGAAGRLAPLWTDASPVAGTTPIRAMHVMELRAAVLALE